MAGTWLGLATVLAAAVPSALAAIFSYRAQRLSRANARQLVTGNDKTVGEMLAEVHGKESQQDTDFETHRPGA